MWCSALVAIVFLAFAVSASTAPALPERIQGDLKAVTIYRSGLNSIIEFAKSRTDLFPPKKLSTARMLSREQKEAVWNAWKAFLDYTLALDAIGKNYEHFYLKHGAERDASFLIAYGSFMAQYRFALELIELTEHDPGFRILLNEPVPEIGLPKNSYEKVKLRFLNVARAGEFAALEATRKTVADIDPSPVIASAREDANCVWKAGVWKGEELTAKNALRLIKQSGFTAYFPVQAGVSEWMGDTKVLRQDHSLVTQEQIREIAVKLEPGDILLERREWYLSNIGLPGFWPHAALYVGTPEQRKSYFQDAEVKSWVLEQGTSSGDFEDLLRNRSPQAYSLSLQPFEGHTPRVLEAMSEGVVFTSLEHSAEADSVAVLRPRLSKKEKAVALVMAFHYMGRPYDFNFDFLTDSKLVCTELIYKAYEPSKQIRGLKFPLVEILGRKTTPANEIVKQFDAQYGTPQQQFDFVSFLDGVERARKAVSASVETFRRSWKRPKWYLLKE